MDFHSLGIVSEALEYGDSSVRETIAVHLALHALPIFQWGTEEQKDAFLPDLAAGAHIACFGLTEPGAGSDVSAIQSRARRDGDSYILTGEKMWITLADVADRFLVFAKTQPEDGARGISAFIVERGWEGLTTGTLEGKMGVRASNTGWINMQNVRVPATHRLGRRGRGIQDRNELPGQRPFRRCRRRGRDHSRLHRPVGPICSASQDLRQPIAEHQLIQQMIAQMQQDLDIGELLVWKVGALKNRGERNTRETSMAKWVCTEAARRAADNAVQIHGAYGYSDEFNVERHLRNTKSAVIYEGTSQIHTLMQAAYTLGLRQDRPLRCPMPAYDEAAWQEDE